VLQAPCIMIGEKAAEMIAAEHGVALNNFVGTRGTKRGGRCPAAAQPTNGTRDPPPTRPSLPSPPFAPLVAPAAA